MNGTAFTRPPAREAGPDLLCLQKWEDTAGWLIESTAKWPKSARFSLVQKVDNHALDIVELLVIARYEPSARRKTLREINLRLERLRFLLRIARTRNVMPADKFETAMRGVDELGRMLHGWRVAIGDRVASDAISERVNGRDRGSQEDVASATAAEPEIAT